MGKRIQKVAPEGAGQRPAQALARALIGWLPVKRKAATLTRVADHFNREISTISHPVSALEERSRNSESVANILNQHPYAICQACPLC